MPAKFSKDLHMKHGLSKLLPYMLVAAGVVIGVVVASDMGW